MNLLVMVCIVVCAAIIQAIIPASPALGQATVPALASVVVYYALARHRADMLWAAVLAGLLQDGLGLIPFGYSSCAFCLMGAMIARFKELVFVHEMLTHLLFGVLMAAGTTLLLFVLLTSTGLIEMPVLQAFHKAFGSALLGAVATPLIFHGCARMDRLMGLVESSDTSWYGIP